MGRLRGRLRLSGGRLVAVGQAQGGVGALHGAGVDGGGAVDGGRAGLARPHHRRHGAGQTHAGRIQHGCGGEDEERTEKRIRVKEKGKGGYEG